jgi:glycosyltransferase involved in cell wall biosynthesis
MRTSVLGQIEQDRAETRIRQRKVLFITRAFDFGGAENHLLELVRRLDANASRISILCLGKDLYSSRLGGDQAIEVNTVVCPPNSLWAWIKLFRGVQADVVVFIYGWIWALPWTASIGARLAGVPKRISIQHLITPADANRGWVRGAIRKLFGPLNLKLSASLFQSTIAVSADLRNSLIRDFGYPERRVMTIHNGVSLTEFSPSAKNGAELRNKLGLRSEDFVLVCTARLSEQKGIDVLLQGISRAMQKGVHSKCLIIGEGPLKEKLIEQARDLGISEHVYFEGFSDDVRPYLQASSAFILTSYREGLPISILEAMACGLPCIVTNVGGNSEAVTDMINGLVIPAGSPEAVANAIMYLASHVEERAQMAKRARSIAQDEFDIEKCIAGISRVILN